MITIDLLKHEEDQAKQIAEKAIVKLVDEITLGPLLTEDQIKYIWYYVAQQANKMNEPEHSGNRWDLVANKAHNMKSKI